MSLEGDAGVFGCRAETGEEDGVDGPLKDARRLLIVKYVQKDFATGEKEWILRSEYVARMKEGQPEPDGCWVS